MRDFPLLRYSVWSRKLDFWEAWSEVLAVATTINIVYAVLGWKGFLALLAGACCAGVALRSLWLTNQASRE